MKKILISAAVVVSLTGCTKVVEVQTTVPGTPAPTAAPQSPAAGSSSVRDEFIYGVKSLVDIPVEVADELLWDSGQEVCDMARSGDTLEVISGKLASAAEYNEEIMNVFAAVAASAITYICPEYQYLFGQA